MQTIRTLVALAAFAAAGLANAQEVTTFAQSKSASNLSRAAVAAEAQRAQAAGEIAFGQASVSARSMSTRDRAAVRADGTAALRSAGGDRLYAF